MPKNKQQNQLEKIFHFTTDDLVENRSGKMTLAQQFGLNEWERKAFGWLLKLPFMTYLKTRAAIKISGRVKKQFTSKIVMTGSGRSGGGQQVFEQRQIQILAHDATATFFVNEQQYQTLRENTDITVYYDTLEQRIISVESNHAKE